MDFPDLVGALRHRGTLHTYSLASMGGTGLASSPTSTTWLTANLAIYVPVRIATPLIAKQLFLWNGATVSGNVDMGIYDVAGRRIVSAGSTAQAGTSVLQLFDITDTWLGRGLYYFGLAFDNTTATITRGAWSDARVGRTVGGTVQQATAFPLPTTATFAVWVGTPIPNMGLTTKVVI